eukprot:jgi/Chrzof1/7085/Cz02g10090.t1
MLLPAAMVTSPGAIYLEEWMTNGIYEPPSSGVSFGPRNVGGGGDGLAVNRNSGGWTNDRQRSQNNNNYQNNQNYRRDQRDQRPDNRPPPKYNGFNNNTQRNGPGNYNNQAGNGPVGRNVPPTSAPPAPPPSGLEDLTKKLAGMSLNTVEMKNVINDCISDDDINSIFYDYVKWRNEDEWFMQWNEKGERVPIYDQEDRVPDYETTSVISEPVQVYVMDDLDAYVMRECAAQIEARNTLKGQVNTPNKAYDFASTLDGLGYRKQAALIRTAESEWYYVTNAWYIIDSVLTKHDLKCLGLLDCDDGDNEPPPSPTATVPPSETTSGDDLAELMTLLKTNDPLKPGTAIEPRIPTTQSVNISSQVPPNITKEDEVQATKSPSAECLYQRLQEAAEWAGIHMMQLYVGADSDAESIDLTDEVYYDYILAQATKRPVPPAFQHRLPRKRTAIDTGVPMETDTPYGRSAPGPSAPVNKQTPPRPRPPPTSPTDQRPQSRPQPSRPQAPQPTNVPNINRTAPQGARPQGPRVMNQEDPAARADSVILPADVLADQKGREMAIKACRDIRVDGIKESAVVIQAVKTCCAGHILGDMSLVDRGKDMARRVDAMTRRMNNVTHSGASGSSAAQVANYHSLANQDIFTISSVNKGYLKEIPITVGRLNTKINATVCDALNYDVLLGSDFFGPHDMVIDYGNGKLHYQLDDDTRCSVDISYGGQVCDINLAYASDTDSDSSLLAEAYLLEPVEYEPEHPAYDYDGASETEVSIDWGNMWDSSEEEEEAIDEDVGGEEYLHYDGYDGFDSFAEENDDDSEDDSDYEAESGDDDCMPEAFLTLRDHVDFPLSRLPRFLTQGARPRRRRYEEAVIDCVDDEMTEYQGCDEFEVDDEFEVEIFMNNEVLEDGEIMSDTGAEMPENNEKLHPEEGEIVSDEVDSYDAEIFMNDEIKKGCIVESSYDSDKAKQQLAFDEDALMVYVAKYKKDIIHAMSGPFLIHTTMDLGREKLPRIMGSRSELYHQSRLSALYNVKFIEHNIVPLMPMPNGYEQNIEESMRHLRIKGPFEPPSLYRKWAEFLALFQAIDTYQSKDLKWHMWMKSLFISAHYPNLREGYGWLKYCENLEGREQSPVTVLYNAYVWKAFKLPLTAKHVTRLIGVEELMWLCPK